MSHSPPQQVNWCVWRQRRRRMGEYPPKLVRVSETAFGALLNAPNWLKTVKAGDPARIPLGAISDWMYASSGEVYGAFTVNLMRSRMGRREREEHDSAWGLDFGDPKTIRLVPQKKGWFGRGEVESQEHPMSEAMAPPLGDQLVK